MVITVWCLAMTLILSGLTVQADDPLDSLRNRSASNRWEKAKANWRERVKTAEVPVQIERSLTPPQADPFYSDSDAAQTGVVLQPETETPIFPMPPSPTDTTPESPVVDPIPMPDLPSPGDPAPKTFHQLKSEPAPKRSAIREWEPRSISTILPFDDYVPPGSEDDDACLYLCPRPDSAPCATNPGKKIPVCPVEKPLGEEGFEHRSFADSMLCWNSSNLFYNPLYFEDPQLERYGHTIYPALQPFKSVGRFGVQLIGLPYQMTIDPVCKKRYPLGYYRPGECAPKKWHQIGLNAEAAAVQAGVMTGLFFAVP